MDYTETRRVGIIGAGVAGLATARQLTARGIDCTLFERGDVLGGVWAVGYSGFGAQVQKELYEFPDFPLPADTPDFTPGPVIQRYLEDYARHFGVWDHIRFGTSVIEVREPSEVGGSWTIVTERAGRRREDDFDMVVVAIGLYSSRPHLPSFPGQERFEGEIMHVSSFQEPEQAAGKDVVVVGFGKSATDAALESAAVADRTTLVFREPHWPVPRKLLGVLPFKWAMLSRLTSALIPPYYRPSRAERAVHTLGRPLVWLWWRLVELLLIAQCKLGPKRGRRVSLIPSERVEIDTLGEAVMLPRPELYRSLRDGSIEPQRAEIRAFTESGVVLANGETRSADVVLLGTGWKSDHSFLSADVRDAIGFHRDGYYLYRQMIAPEAPGLVFIGSASTIENIATYSIQARWLAELIAGGHELPGVDEMRRDVRDMRDWKRRVMPFSSARGARLLLHMLHYHDQLLLDMGCDPRRKRGIFAPFKEVFAPYQPGDYRGVVMGQWGGRNREPGPTSVDLAA
jgi:dimethylaniline monooxygenase (N-oxide forming)